MDILTSIATFIGLVAMAVVVVISAIGFFAFGFDTIVRGYKKIKR